MPPCSRPSRTLRAADAVAAKSGSSLTAAARDGRHRVQVGTEGWSQSNKRMDEDTADETLGEPSMRASLKEALIERVYQEAFVGRWKPSWEKIITDRSVPLKARLRRRGWSFPLS